MSVEKLPLTGFLQVSSLHRLVSLDQLLFTCINIGLGLTSTCHQVRFGVAARERLL